MRIRSTFWLLLLLLASSPAFAQSVTDVLTAKETSLEGPAPTTSFVPSTSLVNLIRDPSFEAGRPPAQTAWVGTNATYIGGSPILSPSTGGPNLARTGQFYAVLGSGPDANETGISQQVTAPAGTYTLSFFLLAGVNAGSDAQFIAEFNGVEVFRATPATIAEYTGNYAFVSVPVTVATAGTFPLVLRSTKTPASPFTNFFFDDVSLDTPIVGPSLLVAPAPVAFGTVSVGATATARRVALTNNGSTPVTISSITSSGAPFVVNSDATTLTIAPRATTAFTVTFAPTAVTASTGSVTVVSDAPGSPFVINLSGRGVITSTIPPGTTVGGPVWARPLNVGTGASGSCGLSGTGGAVNYKTIPFSVTTAGLYTITTAYPADFNGYIHLYRTSFNPMDQCLNLVALSDNFAAPPATAAEGSQIADQNLAAGNYILVVSAFASGQAGTYSGTIGGTGTVSFAVASEGSAPDARTFLSASPNPASSSARVRFASAEAQTVSVAVYDVTGRQVATLFQGAVAADQLMDLALNTSSLAPGVYVVRATGASLNLTQRVTVVR